MNYHLNKNKIISMMMKTIPMKKMMKKNSFNPFSMLINHPLKPCPLLILPTNLLLPSLTLVLHSLSRGSKNL